MTEAVFFDLDGTLADTAPDLAGALNRVRLEQGEVPVDPALLRPWTSNGVAGMLWAGFSITREDPRYSDLAERFLAFYEQSLCLHTRLFDGMAGCYRNLNPAAFAGVSLPTRASALHGRCWPP